MTRAGERGRGGSERSSGVVAATELVRRPTPRAVLVAAALVLLIFLGAAGLKSRQDLVAARGRAALLDQRIQETEERIAGLRRKVARLTDDPVLLETLAREDLGMVHPRDVVVVYPEPTRP